jgi:hypothetical protein
VSAAAAAPSDTLLVINISLAEAVVAVVAVAAAAVAAALAVRCLALARSRGDIISITSALPARVSSSSRSCDALVAETTAEPCANALKGTIASALASLLCSGEVGEVLDGRKKVFAAHVSGGDVEPSTGSHAKGADSAASLDVRADGASSGGAAMIMSATTCGWCFDCGGGGGGIGVGGAAVGAAAVASAFFVCFFVFLCFFIVGLCAVSVFLFSLARLLRLRFVGGGSNDDNVDDDGVPTTTCVAPDAPRALACACDGKSGEVIVCIAIGGAGAAVDESSSEDRRKGEIESGG